MKNGLMGRSKALLGLFFGLALFAAPAVYAADGGQQAAGRFVEQASTDKCPVCLEDNMGADIANNALVTLACKHKMCGRCFASMALRGVIACPTCRVEVAAGQVAPAVEPALSPGTMGLRKALKTLANGANALNLLFLCGIYKGFRKQVYYMDCLWVLQAVWKRLAESADTNNFFSYMLNHFKVMSRSLIIFHVVSQVLSKYRVGGSQTERMLIGLACLSVIDEGLDSFISLAKKLARR